MNILVCIKPDHTGQEIGPFEHLALEAGLTLKETCQSMDISPARLDVILAGPKGWEDCLVRALGTGADRGLHVLTPSDIDGPVPASVCAGMLARVIPPGTYDLILTGVMSQDLMAGQTGPMLARMLEIPCATAVTGIDILSPDGIRAIREMDGGIEETLEVPLPALISIQSGRYTPRYPVLSHMLKAREKPVEVHPLESLPQATETFLAPVIPEQLREGRIAAGPIRDQVAAFDTFLRERGLI